MGVRGRLVTWCVAIVLGASALPALGATGAEELHIHGYVRTPDGEPRDFFRVDAYKLDEHTGTWSVHATYGASEQTEPELVGRYDVWTGPGVYRLKVTACATHVGDNDGSCYWGSARFYGGDTFESATDVTVTDTTEYVDLTVGDPTATLSGRVVGPEGPVPGAGVSIQLPGRDYRDHQDAYVHTDASGFWQATVSPGLYRIRFVPPESSGLSTAFWGGSLEAGSAQILPVQPGALLTHLDGHPRRRGTISGTVTAANGEPDQIRVTVVRADNSTRTEAVAGPDGRFTLAADADVKHWVYFRDRDAVLSWWPSTAQAERAATVTVAEGDVVELLHEHPARVHQGTVAGRVTDEAGLPLSGIRVQASSATPSSAGNQTSTTGVDGRYSMDLPPGTYTVCFDDTRPDQTYAEECWDDQHRRPSRTWWGTRTTEGLRLVHVADGERVPDIDASLSRSGTLEGTVGFIDPDPFAPGTPRIMGTITAYRFDEASGRWRATADLDLSDSGSPFRLAVPPGRYRLRASAGTPDNVVTSLDRERDWWVADQWWPTAEDFESSAEVVVTPGQRTTTDFALTHLGEPQVSLSGLVLDEEGRTQRLIAVRLDDQCVPYPPDDAQALVADSVAELPGTRQQVLELPPGRYRVWFPGGGTSSLDSYWWPRGHQIMAGEDVFVRAGQETSGVDGLVQPRSTVSGRVMSFAGSPLPAATVRLEVRNPEHGAWSLARTGRTGLDGTYTFHDVEGGDYRVRAYGGSLQAAHGGGAWSSSREPGVIEPFTIRPASTIVLDDITLTDRLPVTSSVRAPLITGEPVTGDRLSADAGEWSPEVPSVAYQWNRDGRPISGATRPDYALGGLDIGGEVSVTVTAFGRDRAPGTVTVSAGVVADDATLTHAPDEPRALDVVRPDPFVPQKPVCEPWPEEPPGTPTPAPTPTPSDPTPSTGTPDLEATGSRRGHLRVRSPRTDVIVLRNREDVPVRVRVAGRTFTIRADDRRKIVTSREVVRWRARWMDSGLLRARGWLRVR